MIARLVALAALSAAAAAPAPVVSTATVAAPPITSRPAEKGCVWFLFKSAELGLQVPYQRCEFRDRVIEFGPGKRSFFQSMQDKGKKADIYPVITMFEKKDDEAPDDAIRRVGYKKLSWYKKRHCVVTATRVPRMSLDKQAFTISPDKVYAAKVAKEAGTDIPEPPCGVYGDTADSITYFEFHPGESTRRFAFVSAGQDAPLFDETQIKFLP